MSKNKISIVKIIEKNKLQVLNREAFEDFTYVEKINLHRMGLELSGSILLTEKIQNIIGWGSKENFWFKSLSQDKLEEILTNIIKWKPPLIILSTTVDSDIVETIVKIANIYSVPVTKSEEHLSELFSNISSYLSSYLSEEVMVHASAVIINGVGVLIIGKSGVGKSEAVIELVQKGHIFVSDDSVEIRKLGKYLIGRPAKITQNFLEIRGIGLINIEKVYGSKSTASKLYIDIVVELVISEPGVYFDRLGTDQLEYEVLGSKIKKIQIPVKQGRSTASLIEAVVNWKISNDDEDKSVLEIIHQRMRENNND